MTSFQNQILVITILTITSLSYLSTALPNSKVDSHGFSAPLFDQTLNITKDFQYWSSLTQATMARANYIESLTKFSLTEYTYQIPASLIASGYVVKLRLGGPYVDVTLVVDTGSSIIWTQCQPCKNCFNQSSALYDPEESSLSDHVPCMSRYCSANMKCMDDLCTYYIGYGGGSYSKGYLAADMISFSADNYKTKYALVSVVVGCGQDNMVKNVNGRFTGILGLNGSPLSFISQAGSNIRVFSYCSPSLGDTTPRDDHFR